MAVEMMTLASAKKTIEDQEFVDEVFDVGKLPVSIVNRRLILDTSRGTRGFSSSATSQLKWFTGINSRTFGEYLDSPAITSGMINHCLAKRSGKQVRVSYDKTGIISIGKSEGIIPITKLLDVVGNEFPEIEHVEAINRINRGYMEVRFVSNVAQSPAKRVGDATHTGVWVTTNGFVSTTPYIVRLVCTNGMLRTTPLDKYESGHEIPVFIKNFRRCLDSAKELCSDFMSTDDKPVADPHKLLINICRHFGISPRNQYKILALLPTLPDNPTGYDLVNLVTSVGRSVNSLRWAAPRMLNSFKDQCCSHCGTKI